MSTERKDCEVIPFAIGDAVTMRKQHPCGSNRWNIYRVGADIGMLCNKCGRRVMMSRYDVQRRMKNWTPATLCR